MKKPGNYVEVQRDGNMHHLDGRVEHPDDVYPIYDAVYEMEQWTVALPSSILVLGCRTGYELEALAQRYPHAYVLGVDIVPEFVKMARKRGNAIEADMHDLPLARDLFDWTFCIGTLEHAYNARRAARELLRVTRHALYVTADMEEEWQKTRQVEGVALRTPHYTFITKPEEWKSMFRYPGWRLAWEETLKRTLYMVWRKDDEARQDLDAPSAAECGLPLPDSLPCPRPAAARLRGDLR